MICQPMLDAGIKNPDSQVGIDFCIKCSEKKCVFDDIVLGPKKVRAVSRKSRAIELTRKGLSPKEISRILGVGSRAVQRYLK